jgi:light-regulated signal transduction histidine kinase (bacteriophytochrome)
VDRHHGRAWAEGTVGDGAAFFFTLQAAPVASA